jgi:hypothetical protein
MLIFGKRIGDWKDKANYALDKADNEYAKLHEVRCEGFEGVHVAIETMAAFAVDTKCKNFLYHATLNLYPGERLSRVQWQYAIAMLEKNLKLNDHYRIVFEHIKKDRQHYHIIWARIPPEGGPAVKMDYNYFVHQKTARTLEKEFRLKPAPRRDRSKPSKKKQEIRERNAELRINPEIVTKEATWIFKHSQTARTFIANLAKLGYILTRTKNAIYVIVDRKTGYHGLVQRLEGTGRNDLRDKFPELASVALPSLSAVLKARRPAPAPSFKSTARLLGRKKSKRPRHRPAGYKPTLSLSRRPSLSHVIADIRRREEMALKKRGITKHSSVSERKLPRPERGANNAIRPLFDRWKKENAALLVRVQENKCPKPVIGRSKTTTMALD